MENKIYSLTSNQYYKGLSNRYDKRVKKLIKSGYSLDREYMAWYKDVFLLVDFKTHRLMSNEFVFHADKRSFMDKISKRSHLKIIV